MGKAQHGQMSVVGYDLYVKMLDNAIRVVKGEIEEEELNTSIDMKIDAYIPSTYIEDETHKIEVYKRIAAMETEEDYEDIKEELLDRYSDIPDSLYNLIDIARLKFYANRAGILEIKDRGNTILMTFASPDKLTPEKIDILMKKYSKKIEFQRDFPGVVYKITEKDRIILLEHLTKLMKELAASTEVAKEL